MEAVGSTPAALRHAPGRLLNVALPLLVIAAALAIGAVLISTPPRVPRSEVAPLAAVAGVSELVPQDAEVFVESFGTVVPAREIRVMPQVSGRVIELSENLEPGGLISAGELLFAIDPADYDLAVAQAQADLEVAELEVSRLQASIESLRSRGEQLDVEIAYLQWNADRLERLAEQNSAAEAEARDSRTKLASQQAARRSLDAEISEVQEAVSGAIASVRLAERRLDVAKLARQRTEVSAPFDAMVVSESVEKGQLVGPQSSMATLVSTDEFWAEAAIPVARLRDVRFAVDQPDHPSRVEVRLATGGDDIVREGIAVRALGDLDRLGRMARVLVSIKDPLGLEENEHGAARSILLGSYVRLHIDAGTLTDVFPIPRKALRENDRIWVRDADGRLAIRPVQIVWRRHEDVLVRNGFAPGDQLVTTHLASIVPGMPLSIRESQSTAGPADASTTSAPGEGEPDTASSTTP